MTLDRMKVIEALSAGRNRMTTIEVLREGRDRIAAGFCKNTPSKLTPDGQIQYCAVGAVCWNLEAMIALYPYLPEEHRSGGSSWLGFDQWHAVVTYNNHPKTTQADMVALFEKALAEEGGLA